MKHVGYYAHSTVKCPQCGNVADAWRSVPDPDRRHYQREGCECAECGYSYYGHDRELSPEQAAGVRTDLGDTDAIVECPRCHGKAASYSRRYDIPSHKQLFQQVADRVCEQCHLWHTESISQLIMEYVNR